MFINIPPNSSASYQDPVSTSGDLPSSASEGDIRLVLDTGELVYYNGSSWESISISGAGISTLNGLSDSSQTLAVGTAGTDFAISSAGDTHTFNIPDASTSARGVVTTGVQTFGGNKTFNNDLTVTGTFTPSGGISGIEEYKVESFTLTGPQITAGEVTLAETPTTANLTSLDPQDGIPATYGTDFTVSGTTLSWSGLGLDGLLEVGETIRVEYN